MSSGLADPPPPDFAPGSLLEGAVLDHWPSLLVLVVSIVLSSRNRWGTHRGSWLGLAPLVVAFRANRDLVESLDYGTAALHLWYDLFTVLLALALLFVPIVALALGRREQLRLTAPGVAGPAAAVAVTVLDHLFLLFLLTRIAV